MIKKIINWVILTGLIIFIGIFVWNNTVLCSPYYFNKGKELYNQNQYDASIKFFERSLQANPNNPKQDIFML